MPSLIALDLETTGLINGENYPKIVELGVARAHTSELRNYSHAKNFLLNPEMAIPEIITTITGIVDSDVADQPTIRRAFPQIAKEFLDCECLITFNGEDFDIPILINELQSIGKLYNFPWPIRHFDVMKLSKTFAGLTGKRGPKYPKLTELYQILFEKEYEGQHRAATDAQATLECFLELVKREVIAL